MKLNLKTYLFIYLELFCLRFYRRYESSIVQENYSYIRDFISNAIYDDYYEFRRLLSSKSCTLDHSLFKFIQDFLRYINRFE